MAMFGQFILGPPGAGKTTYAHGMQQLCLALKRPYLVINLDPGNDQLPYDRENCIDIKELITVEDVMDEYHLGPNGGLVFAMEFVETHLQTFLYTKLKAFPYWRSRYLIFDLPGQVELYLHHTVMKNITKKLSKDLDLRLCCVHLVDSTWCRDAGSFVAGVLTALTCTMHLELPPVNVLTKVDLMRDFAGDLPFRLDYYLGVEDLSHLLHNAGVLRDAWQEELVALTEGAAARGAGGGPKMFGGTSGTAAGGGANDENLVGVDVGNRSGREEERIRRSVKGKIADGEDPDPENLENRFSTGVVVERDENGEAISDSTAQHVGVGGEGAAARQREGPIDSQRSAAPPRQTGFLQHPLFRKFRKFYEGLAEIVEEYNLIRFDPCNIEDKESVYRILLRCDQSNGRVFAEKACNELERAEAKGAGAGGGNEPEHAKAENMFDAVLADSQAEYAEYIDRLQEKYLDPPADGSGS